MKLSEAINSNEFFIIEEIVAPEVEIETLKVLGIEKGVLIKIMGPGYLEGSCVVLVNNNLLELNAFFLGKIKGSIVNKEEIVKKLIK